MKTLILSMLLAATTVIAQEKELKPAIFSLTPRSANVNTVNGLTFGLGLSINEDNSISKINGLNLDINPLAILVFMFDDPSRRDFSENETVVINGLSLSSGSWNANEDIKYNGLEIAAFNSGFACNGISINGFYNYTKNLNGLHITGIGNYSEKANGVIISLFNKSKITNGLQLGVANNSDVFGGLQIGIFNKSMQFKGIQIGVFNTSKSQKGLQLGFWNVNNKRSMPFINW